jgi:hypothetical protein
VLTRAGVVGAVLLVAVLTGAALVGQRAGELGLRKRWAPGRVAPQGGGRGGRGRRAPGSTRSHS